MEAEVIGRYQNNDLRELGGGWGCNDQLGLYASLYYICSHVCFTFVV